MPFLLLSMALWLASATSLSAGENADVELGLAIVSPPCGLQGGDLIDFFVAARHMKGVRQVKLVFSWQPPEAVATASGAAAGIAAEQAFLVPGPPLIEGNWAEFGMATFGSAGLEGEGILARFGFALAESIAPDTPVEIRVEMLSLGPSSTQRDTILPVQALALANYCDAEGRMVERGLFLRPRQAQLPFSPSPHGQECDGSEGELLVNAHFLEQGSFRVDQLVTWTLDNQGLAPVYVLAEAGILRLAPGDRQVGFSRTDERGDALLLLDAEPGPTREPAAVELTACSEWAGEEYCDTAHLVWGETATAVVEPMAVSLPGKLSLAQNYPNPFNASTVIPVSIPPGLTEEVKVEIFNLMGQRVELLFAGSLPPGLQQFTWKGQDQQGQPLASGLYLCRLRAGEQEQVRPMLLRR